MFCSVFSFSQCVVNNEKKKLNSIVTQYFISLIITITESMVDFLGECYLSKT